MNYLIGISLVRDKSVRFMKQNINHKLVHHWISVRELQEINLEVYHFEFEMEAHL